MTLRVINKNVSLLVVLSFAVLSLGFELGNFYIKRNMPHPHEVIRRQAIESQAEQAVDEGTLFVGDSIVELAYLPQFCDSSALNAGMGGGTVATTLTLLTDVLTRSKPKRIVIAVGVNDHVRGKVRNDFIDTLKSSLQLAKSRGAQVVVTTIAPVAKDLPLGDRYFDVAAIRRSNDEIRRIANEQNVKITDFDQFMASTDGYLPKNFTKDGVHLTAEGYRVWRRALEKVACSRVNSLAGAAETLNISH